MNQSPSEPTPEEVEAIEAARKIFAGPINFLRSAPDLKFLPDPVVNEVAFAGRSNVGKSSLLNKLAHQQRSVVDNVAGTTVDPVDELVEVGGTVYRFIDTAGIRRRVKEASGHEYYASLRTASAITR